MHNQCAACCFCCSATRSEQHLFPWPRQSAAYFAQYSYLSSLFFARTNFFSVTKRMRGPERFVTAISSPNLFLHALVTSAMLRCVLKNPLSINLCSAPVAPILLRLRLPAFA